MLQMNPRLIYKNTQILTLYLFLEPGLGLGSTCSEIRYGTLKFCFVFEQRRNIYIQLLIIYLSLIFNYNSTSKLKTFVSYIGIDPIKLVGSENVALRKLIILLRN